MLTAVRVQTEGDVWARIDRLARTEQAGGVLRGTIATDADGTLWSGDVGEDLFHAFLGAGRVEPQAEEAMRREARAFHLSDAGRGLDVAHALYGAYRTGAYPEERICELMAWCFGGWRDADVRAFARDVVERSGLAARFHPELHALLARARAAGIEVFLVSASPIVVVREAGQRAGFDEAHMVAAATLEHAGVVLPDVDRPIPYGPGKVRRLRERIGDRPLYAAFGDNAFDVALLSESRVPVAVRPKHALRARAGEVTDLVELSPDP
jgi:HAD superfamily phosphoserine phosphatase-like hydrolase